VAVAFGNAKASFAAKKAQVNDDSFGGAAQNRDFDNAAVVANATGRVRLASFKSAHGAVLRLVRLSVGTLSLVVSGNATPGATFFSH
jgi:hypothetical protein